ncbi:MAG: isochorismatase family protein [Chloroflexi bacterium]|nr:isochorismatase family protein [Chloroflexota bacterium]
MRRWEAIYTEADRIVAEKGGFGRRQAFGQRPAFLIIDVIRSFIGSTPEPVVKSVDEYGTSCGEVGWQAVGNIRKLLDVCRANDVPTVYTVLDLAACRWSGLSATKQGIPAYLLEERANQVPDAIAPLPSELVVPKVRASGFYATPLDICLRARGIDSLLIAGTTTSGCVRATVVDALSCGYKCFLVEECTFDRFELSHLVNLFDINAKYADVITLDEAIKYVTEARQP